MKFGRKVNSEHVVVYIKRDEAQPSSRFGFVVAKTVGGAVQRNLVKRRLRAIARTAITDLNSAADKFDIVVRALPGSASADWNKLQTELLDAIAVAAKKARA